MQPAPKERMFPKLIQAFLGLRVGQTAKVELLNTAMIMENRGLATNSRGEDQKKQTLSAQVSGDILAPLKRNIEDLEAKLALMNVGVTTQVSEEIAAPLKRQIEDLENSNLALRKHLVKLDPRYGEMSSESAQVTEEIVAPLKRRIEDLEATNNTLIKHVTKVEDSNLLLRKHLAQVDSRHGQMSSESGQVSEEIVAPLKTQNEDLEATNNTPAKQDPMGPPFEMSSESGSPPGNSASHVSESFRHVSRSVGAFINKLEIFAKYYKLCGPTYAQAMNLKNILFEVMNILFEDFQYESFINAGVSLYPDPVKRKSEYLSLFLDFQNQRGGPDYLDKDKWDARFLTYYERTYSSVCRGYGIDINISAACAASQQNPKQRTEILVSAVQKATHHLESLASSFRKAAQTVWNLHLLTLSFEPPASLTWDRSRFAVRDKGKFEVEFLWNAGFERLSPELRIGRIFTVKSQTYPVVEYGCTVEDGGENFSGTKNSPDPVSELVKHGEEG